MTNHSKKRKFLATSITATMVAAAVAPVAGFAAAPGPFPDVPATHNYAGAIADMANANVIEGLPNGNFDLGGHITRSQAAQMVAGLRSLQTGAQANTTNFADVKSNVWYTGAINSLVSEGIIAGISATTFAPNEKITRGQLAQLLVVAYDLQGENVDNVTLPFTDITGDEWYANPIKILYKHNLINGQTPTKFGPKDNMKRGDFAWLAANIDYAQGNKLPKPTPSAPSVESIEAINATQTEVKFTKAVDKASLFTTGSSGAFIGTATVTMSTLDGKPAGTYSGKLSSDGKTLTVTTQNPLSKRYDVVIDGLMTTEGDSVAKYEETITISADQTAPTIIGTEKLNASKVKVNFSEPMKAFTTVTFKYADNGAAIVNGAAAGQIAAAITAGASDVTFSIGANIDASREIIATFIGAEDQAGNLISPNPATVSFMKGAADGVAPTVGPITQTGAKSFSIKFSEEIQTPPTVTGTGLAPNTVMKDETDPTVYHYTLNTGMLPVVATTLSIGSFDDLSGENNPGTTKVVTFTQDTTAPQVTSSAVVKDATSKKEYLELTLDKNVDLIAASRIAGGTTNGSYIKNSVTTAIANGSLANAPITYKSLGNKKVVRFELKTLLGNTMDVKDAVYSLNLAISNIVSEANTPITSAGVTFTRGEDGVVANTNTNVLGAPVVSAVANDNSKVHVLFPAEVDGASAVDVSNYSIDGAVIESVTLQPVSGGTQLAILNLAANSNTFTGVRNSMVSGVKAINSSKTMLPFSSTLNLKENVVPTVTSAQLTDVDKVTLTFSESVTTAAVTTDFELLIGGSAVATKTVVTTDAQTKKSTIVFTIENPVSAANIATGLSLKALSGLNILDDVGNNLSVPATITITQ
ncbi:S-layer homology domain-containing protein [Sporosarcina siberiensis]|uniref:S-layer homology domain-containing protein n=1 Tax=Sporosarcina siberiensis TaxID=1365606 RepID=A0ABW4SIB1_9BACL